MWDIPFTWPRSPGAEDSLSECANCFQLSPSQRIPLFLLTEARLLQGSGREFQLLVKGFVLLFILFFGFNRYFQSVLQSKQSHSFSRSLRPFGLCRVSLDVNLGAEVMG